MIKMLSPIFLIGGPIVLIAFLAEYIDSSMGMGYGTILTPILLIIGYTPLQIVPCVLLSEFITGLLAAFLHNRVGNVSFDFKLGHLPKSKDTKIALVLAICSIVGTVIAVVIALNIPKFYLSLFIGILVLLMGIVIVIKHKKVQKFSWKKIIGLGTIASFNKGISGGGYGPIVTSGQILSGVKSNSAIGITSFSEGLTCLVGIICFILLSSYLDLTLAPYLIIGSVMSVPLSVYTVKKIQTNKLTLIIGIATIVLGIFTLLKLFVW